MRVVVLGAGLIGLTSAYYLARIGHQVTVIDKNSAAGLACSQANGGQLSYSHIETWAEKESLFSIIKAVFKPNSFLTISNIFEQRFLSWLLEFFKNSNIEKSEETSQKLFELALYSREALAEIINEEGIKFDYKNTGTLHFYRTRKKFDLAVKKLEKFKGNYEILSAQECVKLEPTLVKLFDEKKLAGGIFYNIDASGNPLLFCKALEQICKEKYGVTFEYNTTIKNIFTNRKKITGINTNKGVFTANKYVVALGAYGNKLLKGIALNPKIYPLKGYSLSIAASSEFIAPKISLTDSENKVVYSRLGNIFRVAGTIEIAGFITRNNSKNVNFLKKITQQTFSDFGNFGNVAQWSGFRPYRPNSMPLICEVKQYGNLLLNMGHGSLGWTLSAASGKIMADLVSDKKHERFAFLEDELS